MDFNSIDLEKFVNEKVRLFINNKVFYIFLFYFIITLGIESK